MKKFTILAMAIGVVAAMALPAFASAEWKHHQTPISENADIPFTGTAEFTSSLGGVRCQVTSTVTFFANQTTGEIDSFTPHPTGDTANCVGTGGLSFCQVHDVTPTELPWQIHTTTGTNTITITHGDIHSQLTGGFCPVRKVTVTPGTSVIATPNQPTDVTSIQLSGAVGVHLETLDGTQDTPTSHAGGTLTIEENSGKKHTYSV